MRPDDEIVHIEDSIRNGDFTIMTNEQYLNDIDVDNKYWHICMDAMRKYGDNHWWEKDADPRATAYYQIHEPIFLLSSMNRWMGALEVLVQDPVVSVQVISAEFMAQVDAAWEAYQESK